MTKIMSLKFGNSLFYSILKWSRQRQFDDNHGGLKLNKLYIIHNILLGFLISNIICITSDDKTLVLDEDHS